MHYAFLNAFYPDPKIVCMVRDPLDILCSMERNYRKASLEKRLDTWVNSPPVGLAMERLLEILRQGIDQQMLFIGYNDLCSNPRQELERYYAYLGLPYYEGHDFNNVKQITEEDDEVYGVLGSDLCNWIRQKYGWFYERF